MAFEPDSRLIVVVALDAAGFDPVSRGHDLRFSRV
jgi:hypothetical protein